MAPTQSLNIAWAMIFARNSNYWPKEINGNAEVFCRHYHGQKGIHGQYQDYIHAEGLNNWEVVRNRLLELTAKKLQKAMAA